MFSFIARRLGLLIPTFFGITLLTFALIRMIPGDPVEVMMGERRVDPEMHAQAMERLGLNKPLYAQYLDYIGKLAQGDLGESLRTRDQRVDRVHLPLPGDPGTVHGRPAVRRHPGPVWPG